MAELFATQATKKAAKARLMVYGVSGSGKTWTSLMIAERLCPPGGKIGLLDTEAGSASKYADEFTFFAQGMKPPFTPQRFVSVVDAAAAAGVDVFLIDGVSPFWSGKGGVLSIVDESRQRGPAGGWKDGTPAQQSIIEAIVNAPMHVIVTCRAKSETVIEQEPGKPATIRKVGMKPDQRDGFDYEFDVVLYLDLDHSAKIEKSRMPRQVGLTIEPDPTGTIDPQPIAEWAGDFAGWLSSGEEVVAPPPAAVEPTGAPAPQAPPSAPAPADPTGGLVDPPPAPEPAAEPAQAPAEPPAAPGEPSSERQAARLRMIGTLAELKQLDPSRDYVELVAAKIPEWYGGLAAETDLDDVQAADLADRLDASAQVLRQRAAAAASS
jgi:hypothetical protein